MSDTGRILKCARNERFLGLALTNPNLRSCGSANLFENHCNCAEILSHSDKHTQLARRTRNERNSIVRDGLWSLRRVLLRWFSKVEKCYESINMSSNMDRSWAGSCGYHKFHGARAWDLSTPLLLCDRTRYLHGLCACTFLGHPFRLVWSENLVRRMMVLCTAQTV